MSYEHCDQHDQDATNGCPECEEIEEQREPVRPFAREVAVIEFCLTTLAEQRDEEHRVAEQHWAAYCGADRQLRAAKERECIAHAYRERAEAARVQARVALVEMRNKFESSNACADELADVRAVLGETQDRLARATRQGDLADGLRETLAKRVAETHDVDEYQRDAGLTATNIPNRQTEILVRCLKLASEAGELADIVGSAIEGSSACDLASMRTRVEGELGDVLWYVARVATLFDLKLSDVIAKNLVKVKARATGGYWRPTYCEFCGHQVVIDPQLGECPFCGAK